MGKLVKDMSPEQRERVNKKARERRENKTPEQIEKNRARNRNENMTLEQIERKRASNRNANLTPEQIERKRTRTRIENMTPEQVVKKRTRSLIENKTPEQIEKNRARNRNENMTPEQIEAQNARWTRAQCIFDNYVRFKHGSQNRSYYIDIELYMELWADHVKKHGYNCAVTGEPFNLEIESKRPSPDQISPSSGYWAWNIRFTTVSYNLARSNYGDDSFDSMVRHYIAKNNIY